jgi:hypothetical protein
MGVTKAMFMTKIKTVLAAVLLVGLTLGSIGVGIGLSTNPVAVAQQPGAKTDEAKSVAKEQPKQGDKVRSGGKKDDVLMKDYDLLGKIDKDVDQFGKINKDVELKKDAGDFGNAVDGLRIKLQLTTGPKEGGKSPSHWVVVMENVGDTDLNLNLGFSLSNGKSHHPVALSLLAIEGNNIVRLTYTEPRVAGRLDPFVVPWLSEAAIHYASR